MTGAAGSDRTQCTTSGVPTNPLELFEWEMRQALISTAPDDGTPILATDGKWTAVVYGNPDACESWRWRISHWAVCQEYDWQPTHWFPDFKVPERETMRAA
jgi:hypothetical protein